MRANELNVQSGPRKYIDDYFLDLFAKEAITLFGESDLFLKKCGELEIAYKIRELRDLLWSAFLARRDVKEP
jgi:hypothetical protein